MLVMVEESGRKGYYTNQHQEKNIKPTAYSVRLCYEMMMKMRAYPKNAQGYKAQKVDK